MCTKFNLTYALQVIPPNDFIKLERNGRNKLISGQAVYLPGKMNNLWNLEF